MAKKHGQGGWVTTGLGLGIAAGVALGTLVIAPAMNINGDAATSAQAEQEEADNPELDQARAEADSADEFVGDSASDIVEGSLDGRPVVIIEAHDSGNASDLSAFLDDAGALDSGRITLTEKFFDQNATDELMSIIANTLPAGAQLSEDNQAPGIHSGESLGAALMYNPGSGEPAASVEDRALVLQTLRKQGFIDYEDGTILPAQGAVILAGSDDALLPDFASALRDKSDAVVVATEGEGSFGEEVPTVNFLERSWAQVSVIQELQEQFDGGDSAPVE